MFALFVLVILPLHLESNCAQVISNEALRRFDPVEFLALSQCFSLKFDKCLIFFGRYKLRRHSLDGMIYKVNLNVLYDFHQSCQVLKIPTYYLVENDEIFHVF